jgi:glycosyltransferase involved in cell wall biosynthesis
MDEGITLLLDRLGVAGGAERYWQVVIPALHAAGVRVRVAARHVDEDARRAFGATAIAWAGDDGDTSPAAARAVRALVRDAGGGIVITANVFDLGVLDVVREEAARWIVRVHDHRPFCPNGDRLYPQFAHVCTQPLGGACAFNALVRGCMSGPRLASLRRLRERLALRDRIATADAVLVSSAYMHASAVDNAIDPRRVFVTPPPLAADAFAPSAPPRPARDTVVFSGRIVPQKGLPSLLRALARIAPAQRPLLVVAGSGGDEGHARRLARRLGVETAWRGWLDTRALRAAIDAATIVAVPSLEAEPFGLVGIEAQARGRPAVAYDVGGIGDWITGAGIPVPRGDERALAQAVGNVLDPGAWPVLSRAAFRAAERYRLAPHVAALLGIVAGVTRPARRVTAAARATPAGPAPMIPHVRGRLSQRVGGTRSSGS